MEGYGERIKEQRKLKKWSQDDLAYKLGYDNRYTVQKWETERQLPDLLDIKNMCRLFNCSADYLTGEIPHPRHKTNDVCSITGLSRDGADTLLELMDSTNIYGKQVIHCINTLLKAVDPEQPLDSALYAIYGFICSDFAIVNDHYNPDIKGLQVRASAPDGTSEIRDLDPIKQKLFRMMYQEDLLKKLKNIASKKRNQ